MPYNEAIADQVRLELAHLPDTHEIKMYGGIAFMVNNKMCVCVGGSKADNIMVRVGADTYEDALKRRGAPDNHESSSDQRLYLPRQRGAKGLGGVGRVGVEV